MNIVIDIRCLTQEQRTGVGEYTYELLNAFFEMDTYNKYFLFYNSWKDVSHIIPQWKQENVHYIVTRWPNKLLHFFMWAGFIKLDTFFKRALKKNGSSSGQSHNLTVDYFYSPNLNFSSYSKNAKYILTIHDVSFVYFKNCFSWKRRLWHILVRPKKQIARAATILAPSENTKKDIMREFHTPKEKVFVARPRLSRMFMAPTGTEEFTKAVQEKYQLPEKFILFLGTLEPRKNIIGMLKAYEKSKIIKQHVEFIIAGSRGWRYDTILQQIDHTHGVRYIGYVESEEKAVLYSLCSAFIYPSLYEGYGLPVAEALACNANVVTSNRSSLPEVAGGKAFLINPHNIEDIRRGIIHYCEKKV